MTPNILAQLVLLGYPALVLVLFALVPVRKAILTGMVGGWLFLPMIRLSVIGIPDYDKVVATNCAVGLGCLLWARRDLFALRPSWIDIPMFLWCLAPSFSSLANGLGTYDAASNGVRQILVWVVPYCIGKAYFKDAAAIRQLAIAFVIGGLVYVPLCLLEIRISPQLNNMIYGFHQTQFWRNIRMDGYRPVVFMNNGLMVGTWMATSTVIAFWLWFSGEKKLLGMPYPWVFGTLLVITILCKALYAIMLMVLALTLLLVARYAKTLVPAMLLLLAVPGYIALRGYEVAPTETITEYAEVVFGHDRAQSLRARLQQEDFMLSHALKRPAFGWGGYRRSWPKDPYTGDYQIRGLDGLWTIIVGQNGLYGVTMLFATLLAPVVLLLVTKKASTWGSGELAGYEVLSISLLIFACDCLLNGMFNPLFLVIAGAITTRPENAPAEQPAADPLPTHVGVPRDPRRINGATAAGFYAHPES